MSGRPTADIVADLRRHYMYSPIAKTASEAADRLAELDARVRRLCIEEPWLLGEEGLDDHCMFCDCYSSKYVSPNFVRMHYPTCAWVDAMAYLGNPLPVDHVVLIDVPAE